MKHQLFCVKDDENFIIDLFYASNRNFLYKDFYTELGISKALVHPDLYSRLMDLRPILSKNRLKLVIYDAFRPVSAQRLMFENASDLLRPYIAEPPTPDNNSPATHTRAIAIDCFLARQDGSWLEYPSEPDSFYVGWENDPNFSDHLKRCHRDFMECPKHMLDNRKMLEDMLYGVGLDGNPSEWWHYQLPCFEQYPIIGSMNDIEVMN